MKSFLENVVTATMDLPPLKTLIVFPTQRACQEYRKLIALKKQKADWLPAVLPIRDLLSKMDAPPIADDLTLLLELYNVHCDLFKKETFENFISYGQQIIDDFNEIDRQLIDPDLLFEEIQDLKNLEARFAPGEEDFEYLRSFWSEFIRTPLTPLQDAFLQYWKQLPALYREFNKRLSEKQILYEGMAWRMVANSMAQQIYFSKYSKVIFAGFYALNKTEEKMMEFLKVQGKLMIFIDADQFYVNNRLHEAGMFFRKGPLANPDIPWISDYFSIQKDCYTVKGCSGRFSIARELAMDVSKLVQQNTYSASEKTNQMVVVLADESLLFPLLHFCSRLGIPANPSMGFPLKHHPLIRLLHFVKMMRHLDDTLKNDAIQFNQLQEFCAEPLFKRIFSPEELGLRTDENTVADIRNFHSYFRNLLGIVPAHIHEEKRNILDLLRKFQFHEKEWIQQIHFHLIQAVEQTFSLLEMHEDDLDLTIWWQLFLESIEKVRIPFLDTSDHGVPVMGFLETRLMDYESVFIAPLNEDVLPSASPSKSLIPYSIRKAYRLPCKEEQDAVTAYHFYRLIQRAGRIFLYYNTDLNDTGGGERSRYLFQIHHEIIEKIKPSTLHYLQQESRLISNEVVPIVIKKNEAVLNKLREKYLFSDNGIDPKGLSSSAISSYISCSLRFYFDQIVYLRPDDTSQELNAGHFGNVLHKAMEMAYGGLAKMEAGDYDDILSKIDVIVGKAIEEVYLKPVKYGHDFLMKGVLTELIKRIISFDKQNTPFEIVGLEANVKMPLSVNGVGKVLLRGIIDRIDIKGGVYRILDYKTGKDTIKKNLNLQALFSNPEYKLNLQLLIYCLLAKHHYHNLDMKLTAGIFRMREFDEEITFLNDGKDISDETLTDFLHGLGKLLLELFNPDIPFAQTTDLKRCRYCDYNGLCQRQNA